MNDLELYIKFYKSPIGKQNMWIEILGEDGERYEIDTLKDITNILISILKK